MVRQFAQLGTSFWSEPSIRALPKDPQRAYLLLHSQPELSRCGVLPYRLKRLAQLASDDTPTALKKAIRHLQKARHVVVDEDAEELFVRTYVRHDGLLAQPQVVAAMVQDFDLIESTTIRAAFLLELRRIWDLDIPANQRKGLRLAFGEHTDDRFRDKIGPALSVPMQAALDAGSVPPFDPASPQGCPPPFAPGFGKALAGAPAPSPSPAPTPSPTPEAAAVATPASGEPRSGDSPLIDQLLNEHLAQRAMPDSTARQMHDRIHESLTLCDYDSDIVRTALAEWRRRPGAKPGLLPHLVGDVQAAQLADTTDPLTDPDVAAWIAEQQAKRTAEAGR